MVMHFECAGGGGDFIELFRERGFKAAWARTKIRKLFGRG
jgi:hypothetical protein